MNSNNKTEDKDIYRNQNFSETTFHRKFYFSFECILKVRKITQIFAKQRILVTT